MYTSCRRTIYFPCQRSWISSENDVPANGLVTLPLPVRETNIPAVDLRYKKCFLYPLVFRVPFISFAFLHILLSSSPQSFASLCISLSLSSPPRFASRFAPSVFCNLLLPLLDRPRVISAALKIPLARTHRRGMNNDVKVIKSRPAPPSGQERTSASGSRLG